MIDLPAPSLLGREQEAIDQVVDEDRGLSPPVGRDQRESAVVDGFDDLERPPVAGPVSPAGPDDDDLRPASREIQCDPLPFELAPVVSVPRVRGRVLVRDRAGLDRADDADRADVDRSSRLRLPGPPRERLPFLWR